MESSEILLKNGGKERKPMYSPPVAGLPASSSKYNKFRFTPSYLKTALASVSQGREAQRRRLETEETVTSHT